ncbi:MAG: molecular chaperone DnaJ [Chloroflexi bacterium]|nr:molecular chaperone DnaJ [Chloroflexota bacterium]
MPTTKRDYYEVLGIGRSASEDDIRKAYRRLALQFHPDRNKDPGAAEQFKEVKEAYEVLSDSEKRSLYDRFGHAAGERGFTNGGFSGFTGFGIEDIFESFFGAAGSGTGRRSRVQRGADLRTDITLTLEEAVFGCEKDISYPKHEACARCTGKGIEPGKEPVTCPRCNGTGELRRNHQSIFGQMVNVSMCDRCRGEGTIIQDPCAECRGQGVVRTTKTLRVQIPAGIDDNSQIRLSNEGEPGPRGGPPGHLFLMIHVQAHRYFHRQGNDLLVEIPINVAQATLGDEFDVESLDGPVRVKVPAGTQNGRTIRVRSKGVPYLRDQGRGDLLVRLKVAIPTDLTARQRELFKKLAETFDGDVTPQENKGFFGKVKDLLG